VIAKLFRLTPGCHGNENCEVQCEIGNKSASAKDQARNLDLDVDEISEIEQNNGV